MLEKPLAVNAGLGWMGKHSLVLDPEAGPVDATRYPQLRAGLADAELQRWLPGVPAALLLDARGTVVHAEVGGRQAGLELAVRRFLEGPDARVSAR